MPRILLVDDDRAQLSMWRLLLERAGYQVETAADRYSALSLLDTEPDVVVMDWGLPLPEDGERLLADLRRAAPATRILVLTGWPEISAETAAPDALLIKPIRVERLIEAVGRLMAMLLLMVAGAFGQRFPFTVSQPSEVVAEMDMSSPGAEWASGTLVTDGRRTQHVMAWAGRPHRYRVFLGALDEGPHTLEAPGNGLRVERAAFRETPRGDPYYEALAYAPVLYARPDTVARFNDVPLLMYCERRGAMLEYTVIFSNEDGGTDTPALFARWGRATDIEYIYRHDLAAGRATIQAKDHKEIEFRGKRDGSHPILYVATRNNMVAAEGTPAVRYHLAPVLVDLREAARESVMDREPDIYRVMARELARENKDTDPRDYLYVEMRLRNTRGAVAVLVRRGREWRASHRGRADYAISRSEWVRTAVQAPGSGYEEIAIQCLATAKTPGECRIEKLARVFRLDAEYRPGPNLAEESGPLALSTGSAVSVPFRSRR